MDPSVLLANPHVTNKLLAAAGYAVGLGEMDVRELSQTRIPVWALASVCVAAGLAGGVYLAFKLPTNWIAPGRGER